MSKKKRRKGINGKQKGATFERSVANKLTEWTGIEIKRTPMSGGWNKTGDITPIDAVEMKLFPFNFELKNRESWDFSDLLKRTNMHEDGIVGFWYQCVNDAKISKKIPILVFTKNRHPEYCMVSREIFDKLKLSRVAKDYFKYRRLRIFLFDDLLKIKYKTIVKRLGK